MSLLNKIINRIINHYTILRDFKGYHRKYFISRDRFGYVAPNAMIAQPFRVESPQSVFIEENTRIRIGINIINAPTEKVIIKKYTAIGPGTSIIPGNHTSTVGVPHFLLGLAHINDKSKDIIVEEDCWVGANVTLLAGAHLGRGCVVASGCIVSKPVPPYAVVVGTPQKIIAKKFDIDDIIEHEKVLYKHEERIAREELEALFAEYFVDKKTFGTNKPLTEEELQRIQETKEWTQFVEPF